jgi:hypothetical protein
MRSGRAFEGAGGFLRASAKAAGNDRVSRFPPGPVPALVGASHRPALGRSFPLAHQRAQVFRSRERRLLDKSTEDHHGSLGTSHGVKRGKTFRPVHVDPQLVLTTY